MIKVKRALIIVAILAVVIRGCVWMASKLEEYQIRGTCVQKVINSDRYGHSKYHVLVKFEDGSSEDWEVTLDSYLSYTEGITYVFTRQKFNWDK